MSLRVSIQKRSWLKAHFGVHYIARGSIIIGVRYLVVRFELLLRILHLIELRPVFLYDLNGYHLFDR